MKRLLWLSVFFAIGAQAAFAQSAGEATATFTPSPADRAEWELGVISLRNLVSDFYASPGRGDEAETTFAIATPKGDVVISYTRTRNTAPDPSDIVAVLSTPEGYLAVPGEFRVDEGAAATIRIVRFSGV